MIPQFISRHRRSFGAFVVFLILMAIFAVLNPKVFLSPAIYTAVFVSLPLSIILVIPLVFVIVSGEIDLSFPSVVGVTAWIFALIIQQGWNPVLALIAAFIAGVLAGLLNSVLVTRAGLSSLVSTLGMNFLLRGMINLGTQGMGIPMSQLSDSSFRTIFTGTVWGFPAQMIWAIAFAFVGILLFNFHKFGAQVCCVGDNPESSREMGINVKWVKTMTFVYMGIAAALVGVLANLVNMMFWPSTGDGYLLSTLAAVFVGGTPTWGGVGTVLGGAIGAFTVGFLQTGIIAAGGTAFYTQFFYGLVLILALLGHSFNQPRYR